MLRILFFLFYSMFAEAYESSDAFIITANPTFYKVLSPKKKSKKVGLIVKNKTIDKILGKVWSKNRGDIQIITIKSDKMKSIEFKYSPKDRYYFIPMSPPFQRVELKTGESSYEVPSQKEDK